MDSPIRVLLEGKNKQPLYANLDDSVLDCVNKMNEHNIGAIIVQQDEKLLGIFSERDVLRKIVSKKLNPEEVKVSEVMTKKVFTLPKEASVASAMLIMTSQRIRHLPVLEDNKTIGMISIGDLIKWICDQKTTTIEELEKYIHGS